MAETDNSHIKLGQRVAKSAEHPLGWQYVSALPEDKACIVALPGSSADNSRKANGFAKMIQETLEDKSVPVYSVEYGYGDRIFRVDREAILAHYGQEDKAGKFIKYVKEEDKTYIPQYIRELYAAVIAPRLRDDNNNRTFKSACFCQPLPRFYCFVSARAPDAGRYEKARLSGKDR